MKKIAFILFLFAFLQINVAPCQNTSLFMEYLLPNSKTEIFSFLFFVILFILGSHGSNSKEKIIIRKLSIGFFIATFLMYMALPSFPISIAIIKAIIWSLPVFVSSFLFRKRGRMLDWKEKGFDVCNKIFIFKNGNILVGSQEHKTVLFLDRNFHLVMVPFDSVHINDLKDNIFPARVALKEKIGYIDETGKIEIEPMFNEAGPFIENIARVSMSQGSFFYIKRHIIRVKLDEKNQRIVFKDEFGNTQFLSSN